jgi:hypothetical protein
VLEEGLGHVDRDLVARGGDVPVVEGVPSAIELLPIATHARREQGADRRGPFRVEARVGVGGQGAGHTEGVDHAAHGAARGLRQRLLELLRLAQGLLAGAGRAWVGCWTTLSLKCATLPLDPKTKNASRDPVPDGVLRRATADEGIIWKVRFGALARHASSRK